MFFSDKFICYSEEFAEFDKRVPVPLFEKNITPKKPVKSAEITVCGLGFYEFHLNSENITRTKLAPFVSNPDNCVYYDNYDITYALQSDCKFEFLLGNGVSNAFGAIAWWFTEAPFRSAPKLAFAIEITYEDGEYELIEADETVTVRRTKTIADDMRLGEIYDANFVDNNPIFAVVTTSPKGEKLLSKATPIRTRAIVKPINIVKEGNAYIYDFGINASGVCRLKINGKKDQEIWLTYGETFRDGKFYNGNIGFYWENRFQQDRYICKEGENEWTPKFTYHGFRCVKVEGIDESQATADLLTYEIFNTDLARKGDFLCDNEQVNKLNRMSMNSTLSNFHHIPTDCPQREKNGWTADAALSSAHTLLYFEPTENYKMWLLDITRSQRADGALPGIVPTSGWGFVDKRGVAWNGPAWDCVIAEIPYQIWKKRNDISAFEITSKAVITYLKYLETRMDENGLLAIGLGDWCPPHKPTKAPLELTDSVMAYNIARQSAEMFDALSDGENAEYCRIFAEKIRENIRNNLFDKSSCTFKGDCQTSQAIGIYYGIINECEFEKSFQKLLDIIKSCEYHIDTGVIGGRILFHLLAEHGEMDTAMKILLNPTSPSYVQWIKSSGTTLCEGFTENDGALSLNHHFWGFISGFFVEKICGIQPDSDKINIRPNLPSGMNMARASFDSVFGKIEVELKRENGKIVLNLQYPENANGDLILNDSETLKAKSGVYRI